MKKRVNFRPLVLAAVALAFGIFLYCKCAFQQLRANDFLFCALLCYLFVCFPVDKKRTALLLGIFVGVAGLGALLTHAYAVRFASGAEEGNYTVSGTVESMRAERGYSSLTLSSLTIDGQSYGGKMYLSASAYSIEVGDIIQFECNVNRVDVKELFADGSGPYLFTEDVRYRASASDCEIIGRTYSPFLNLNRILSQSLSRNMGGDEADIAYTLLTGNGANMDGTFTDAVQRGGIAHIFAVSGLHIGILFSAVYLLAKPLGKWRLIPAVLLAFFYSGICAFTVSSLRAVIMCSVGGALRTFGFKRDFLDLIATAALVTLLLMPAEWLSVGFQLSFGACIGLALFSVTLSSWCARIKLPAFLSNYIGANFAVQIFTFPILIEAFGFWSVWGTLLNFFIIPALPVVFLGLIGCAALSLIIPVTAPVLLVIPKSLLAVLNFLFSAVDLTAVVTGFTLGVGATVWLIACLLLSQRVNISNRSRAIIAGGLAALFALCVVVENVVFVGCKLSVYRGNDGYAVLVQTPKENVLVMDGEITVDDCNNFLAHRYGGRLDAVVLLSVRNQMLNHAVFFDSERVYARDEEETGLQGNSVIFAENFSVGEMQFYYETRDRLTLAVENCLVEFCFTKSSALKPDLFVGEGSGGLIFYAHGGIIKLI